ncbi:MAG: hypothetical protein LBM93_08595, partial [Oscillospiraceae bacterium]|nr:hypothetical protein [Oscillospiraceae bacterium]
MKKLLSVLTSLALFTGIAGFPVAEKVSAEDVNVTTHILGDIDGNDLIDYYDYKFLEDCVDGEIRFVMFYPIMEYSFDVDRNGFIGEEDFEYIGSLLTGNTTDVYEFKWNGDGDEEKDAFLGYNKISNDCVEQMNFVGDLDEDFDIDEMDCKWLLGEVSEGDTDDWNPRHKKYLRDVNTDGKSDKKDVLALQDVVNGLAPIMAFKWNQAEEKAYDYFEVGYNELKDDPFDVNMPMQWFVIGDLSGNWWV